MSKTTISARFRPDGSVVEVLTGGCEQPFVDSSPRPMTERQAHEAALADLDAIPLTQDDLERMKRVPRAKTLRRALGVTQEEFAAKFQIPLGVLKDWEQGRAEPDQTARTYLRVIAGNPEAVLLALEATP